MGQINLLCAVTIYLCLSSFSLLNAQVSGYNFYKAITIDSAQVSGNSFFLNFPMLFSVTDNDLKHVADGGNVEHIGGYDILFSKDSLCGTLLSHEIERYVDSTGEYIAWVRLDTLFPDNNTEIYLYYGNSSVSSNPSADSVWDGDYEVVLHLKESGNGTDREFKDATANLHHGTGGGVAGSGDVNKTPDRSAGKIGFAQGFVASNNDHIRLDAVDDRAWAEITAQCWINASAVTDGSNDDRLFGKNWDIQTTDQVYVLGKDGGGEKVRFCTDIECQGGNHIDGSNTAFTNGIWYYYALTWKASDNTVRIYRDGVETNTYMVNGNDLYDDLREPIIGNNNTLNRGYDGKIDECRLSKTARSADWIKTEYNNQNTPGTFYSIGAEKASCNAPLPVELLYFRATAKETIVTLSWATATEINNAYFVIEKSIDGEKFSKVMTQQGAGNSLTTQYYNADDKKPVPGTSYYRLKQVDYDGTYTYSDIVPVTLTGLDIIAFYPNPAKTSVKLILSSSHTGIVMVGIYNVLGEKVKSRQFQMDEVLDEVTLNVANLTSGIYLLQVFDPYLNRYTAYKQFFKH